MSKFNAVRYSDNSYAFGEIGDDNYITGFGYSYLVKKQLFAMGEFLHGSPNGWVCSNGDINVYKDDIFFGNWKNGQITEGVLLISASEFLVIGQTNKKSEDVGYHFIIWPDGCWRYTYYDSTNKSRGVQCFDDGHIEMVYIENNEITWHKRILDKENIGNFKVKFHKFTQKLYPNAEFCIDGYNDGYLQTKNDGPNIYKTRDTITIAHSKNGKYLGIAYKDVGDIVSIEQFVNGSNSGGFFCIGKKTYKWGYSYFNEGLPMPVKVWWSCLDKSIEIWKSNDGNNGVYNKIKIDKDFNVVYYTQYNEKTKKFKDLYACCYHQVYNSKEKEVEQKAKKLKSKVKVAKKTKATKWN